MADGGRYRGPRDPKADYFDDIMGDNSTPSIFQTDMGGLDAYERVQKQADSNGITYHMHCRPPGCGAPKNVLISWGELFVVAHAPESHVLPPDWKMSEVNMAPCPDCYCQCGAPLNPIVTPDEAAREVDQALRRNIITEQQLAADPVVQRVQAILGARQRQAAAGYGGGGYPVR